MQYSYSIVEAAALWAKLEPQSVKDMMAKTDLTVATAEMESRVARCLRCPDEDLCPMWKGNADEPVLVCPENYDRPPSSAATDYLPTPPRYVPEDEEYAAFPGLRERLELLLHAIRDKALEGSESNIRHTDLRTWIAAFAPHERPSFLYPEVALLEEQLKIVTAERDELLAAQAQTQKQQGKEETWSKETLLTIIGMLLAVMHTQKKSPYSSDESIRNAIWDFFGGQQSTPRGYGKTKLEDVFSASKQYLRKISPDKHAEAFPRSQSKS